MELGEAPRATEDNVRLKGQLLGRMESRVSFPQVGDGTSRKRTSQPGAIDVGGSARAANAAAWKYQDVTHDLLDHVASESAGRRIAAYGRSVVGSRSGILHSPKYE